MNQFLSLTSSVTKKRSLFLILIPLVLSSFTHLWNPVGFPSLHVDEGHYLRKSLSTMQGEGLQPQDRYYAPYFGQILLAGIFTIIGYPSILHPTYDDSSVYSLYMVPRLIMGVFAIFDTFLIYKIVERRYGEKTAFIASVIFAVMPFSWFIRRIFLESIQLPLLLAAILLPMYLKNNIDAKNKVNKFFNFKNISLLLLSGAFLGLSIFTKIPIFTMIPLVAYVVYSNASNHRLKSLIIWIIPVILIPALWPAHAYYIGDFEEWKTDVLSQTDRTTRPLIGALHSFFEEDPVLFVLGFVGVLYAAIRKDMFIVLFSVPFLIFLYWIDFVSSFHLVPILVAYSISSARLIMDGISFIPDKLQTLKKISPYATIGAIGIFGLISTFMIISLDITSAEIKVHTLILNELKKDDVNGQVTLISSPLYIWIPRHVYNLDYDDRSYYSTRPIQTEKYLMVVDEPLENIVNGKGRAANDERTQYQQLFYNSSTTVSIANSSNTEKYKFSIYPYANLKPNPYSESIELRANYY